MAVDAAANAVDGDITRLGSVLTLEHLAAFFAEGGVDVADEWIEIEGLADGLYGPETFRDETVGDLGGFLCLEKNCQSSKDG